MSVSNYFKRRKITHLPRLYKDAWTLISQYCEWPEASALRMVCKDTKDAISMESVCKSLVTTTVGDFDINASKMRIRSETRDELYDLAFILPYYDPKDYIGRYSILLQIYKICILYNKVNSGHNIVDELFQLGNWTTPLIARFARSHGYIKCTRPKNWDKYFEI